MALADELTDTDQVANQNQRAELQADGGTTSSSGNIELQEALEAVPRVEFRPMSQPLLPAKP